MIYRVGNASADRTRHTIRPEAMVPPIHVPSSICISTDDERSQPEAFASSRCARGSRSDVLGFSAHCLSGRHDRGSSFEKKWLKPPSRTRLGRSRSVDAESPNHRGISIQRPQRLSSHAHKFHQRSSLISMFQRGNRLGFPDTRS